MSNLDKWINENKSGLESEYREYKSEAKQMGEKPVSFREWCKEKFEQNEVEFHQGVGE